jgi:pimeloyl-ACP methyl ester carboxylesterase
MTIMKHSAIINELDYHYVTCGEGPAVLLVHGFPDSSRVWRHQIPAIAAAGYRVIAPDLRGFGATQAPDDPNAYTSADLVSDLVGLLNHLTIDQAVIVGHDWGATAAWAAPVLRPDRFPAVATLSMPYSPRPPMPMPMLMSEVGLGDVYMVYFSQQDEAADAELAADPEEFFRRFFYTLSGDYDGDVVQALRRSPETGRLIDSLVPPPRPMAWCDETEIAALGDAVRRRGRGFIDVYRSTARGWSLWGAWSDRAPQVPVQFIYGNKEVSMRFPGRENAVEDMMKLLPNAFPPIQLEGDVGHWCQLEQPEQVNDALIGFLARIGWDKAPTLASRTIDD